MSKNSRYRVNSEAGMSKTLVAIRKLTNMGFSTLYLKAPEYRPKLRTAPMLR